eukprot:g6698.t1
MSNSSPGSPADLEQRVAELEDRLAELSADSAMASDLDVVWIIVSAVLVFFMQVGFAMLEVGSVSPKNTKAVLLKNIGDASLGGTIWSTLKTDKTRYTNPSSATSVTIVSGAIAERVKIVSYVTYAVVLTSFIYPLVVHWAWSSDGWASPYRMSGEGLPLLAGCGAADFAGSGVVHMVGGVAALVAAAAVKPRWGRFVNGKVCRLAQQSPALQTLGTLILWVGWYAFNAGSTISISGGRSVVAARAVVSTTIGPSAGVLVMVVLLKILEKKFDTRGVNNGILSGLVAVTAGAPLVEAEGAFVIGVVAAVVYYTSASFLLKLQIDDVVDAAPVHLFCGVWGMIATGLFTTKEGWELTYGASGGDRADECCGLFYGCGFNLLFANLALVCAILAWVGLTSGILFFTIDATVGLRVPRSEEVNGMDLTRHSFSTSGSFSAAGGGGVSGGKNGGWNALHRAMAAASGTADPYGGDASMRSHHSSRAASLSGSKHGDMNGVNGGGGGVGHGGAVSNGKHEHAWGWGHSSAAAGGVSAAEQQHRARSIANVFGQLPPASRQSPASLQTSAAEAVTPSVGRAGSGYGFKGGGGGFGDGRLLGVPASEKSVTSSELGQPRSRRPTNQHYHQQQQGWESGVVETKSEDPRFY